MGTHKQLCGCWVHKETGVCVKPCAVHQMSEVAR